MKGVLINSVQLNDTQVSSYGARMSGTRMSGAQWEKMSPFSLFLVIFAENGNFLHYLAYIYIFMKK